jgi:hypothetical protein
MQCGCSGVKTNRAGKAVVAATFAFAIGAGCSEKTGQQGGGAGAPATGGSAAEAAGGGAGQSSGQGGTPGPRAGGASGSAGLNPGAGGSAGVSGPSGGSAGQLASAGSGGTSGAGAGGSAGAGGAAGAGMDCCTAKSCQSDAVQACVCTEWQQADCCSGEWTTFCQATAEQKCHAKHCLPDPPPTDGGTVEKGACCATHSSGGCAEDAVEKCICALLPDCCTKAWDSVCVQLVREKHCEDGVRTCVCETWQQGSCCDTQWTNVCAIVAEDKCGAKPSCP